jgi:hypothetical protein
MKDDAEIRQLLIKARLRTYGYLFLGTALAFLAVAKGCQYFPESTFELANDSRYPKWITLPPGQTRANVTLTMSYYIEPWGTFAGFKLQDKERIIQEAEGKLRCNHALQLKDRPQGFEPGYPTYEQVTVNGITETIEHRKMEPIFYITDDPGVRKQLSEIGCR